MVKSKAKRFLIFCFMAFCLTWSLSAQTKKPRLVVTIAIDGLQNDHLSTLSNSFEKNGFKLLMNGTVIPQNYCNYAGNGTNTDYASLLTGSIPYYHGIVGDKRYHLVEDNVVSILFDGRFQGINSDLTISPKQLATTTLADVIKLNNPQSKVYAMAITAEHAVILGGHVADGAIWIDDKTGKLATTNFYTKGLPAWADKVNISQTIDNYLLYEWRPLWGIESYKFPPTSKDKELFLKPNDKQTRSELIYQFKHTPFVNTLMKDLAIRALRDEKLGTDAFTDFLAIEFSVKLPNEQGNALLSAEKEDSYLRLDKELRALLDAIEISVGLDNTLIVVTGNAQDPYSTKELASRQIANGQFNAKRSMALLNAYLMAIYGQGRYVSGYYARQIYLNQSLIESQKINRQELEQHVAQFMTELQGVHNAYTSDEIKNANGCETTELAKIKNSRHKNSSGNVVFTLLPGWTEINERNEIMGVSSVQNSFLPVLLYGNGIPAQTLLTPVNVTDITPTICALLQLQQPNGCIGHVIPEVIK